MTKSYTDIELVVRVKEGDKGPVPDDAEYEITSVNPIGN